MHYIYRATKMIKTAPFFQKYSDMILNKKEQTISQTVSSTAIKGALPGLRQFLATESSLKMIKNSFYFNSKALFVLKIFRFLSWLLGHVSKLLDWKNKFNLKFYDVTTWLTNYFNTHVAQYLEEERHSGNEIWSVNRM